MPSRLPRRNQVPFRIRTADEVAEFRSVWKEKLRQAKKKKRK